MRRSLPTTPPSIWPSSTPSWHVWPSRRCAPIAWWIRLPWRGAVTRPAQTAWMRYASAMGSTIPSAASTARSWIRCCSPACTSSCWVSARPPWGSAGKAEPRPPFSCIVRRRDPGLSRCHLVSRRRPRPAIASSSRRSAPTRSGFGTCRRPVPPSIRLCLRSLLPLLRGLLLALHEQGGEIDRVEQQRRKAAFPRQIGNDAPQERKQQRRAVDQQKRLECLLRQVLDFE